MVAGRASTVSISTLWDIKVALIFVKSKVVFYWDQPFQPKPVLVETVEVSNSGASALARQRSSIAKEIW